VTLDAWLGFALPPAATGAARVRRLPPRPSPLLFACPSAVLHDAATGLNHGMTEIWQPLADAVAVAEA
jgi:hypothetical protein